MADPRILDTVLLLALPASGKSEVRRYLAHLDPGVAAREFHMGPTVQLDDFPYVHVMRRIDDELVAAGEARVFFHAGDRPFQDTRDWGTLIELLNEDYDDLVAKRVATPASAAAHLLERIERAGTAVGIGPRLASLSDETTGALRAALEAEARALLDEKHASYPDTLAGKTLVVEFARGGPDGSTLPLPSPLGYQYSLGRLDPRLLASASILYVWVTPEESRRKNAARTNPDDPGSILHHGVPLEVMLNDYGTDDMTWLESQARVPGTVAVGGVDVPVGRFDNRVDKTSFLRDPVEKWAPDAVKAVHEGLRGALDEVASFRR